MTLAISSRRRSARSLPHCGSGETHVLVAGFWHRRGGRGGGTDRRALPRVLKAEVAGQSALLAEPLAALLSDLARSYDHMVAAATAIGKNVMPRLAALLGVQPIGDVIEVIDADTFVRPIYAGNGLATVQSSDDKKVLTIRAANFPAASIDGETLRSRLLIVPKRRQSRDLYRPSYPKANGRS